MLKIAESGFLHFPQCHYLVSAPDNVNILTVFCFGFAMESEISSFLGFSTQESERDGSMDLFLSSQSVPVSSPIVSPVGTESLSDFSDHDSDSDFSLDDSDTSDSNSDDGWVTASDIEDLDSQASVPEMDGYWSDPLHNVRQFDFNEETGPAIRLPATATPLDYFNVMFEDSFFQHICTETNRYAEQLAAVWVPTTKEEIMALIGLLIFMSVMQVST